MSRSIYELPTRTLLKNMLNDWALQPGQVFTTSRALEWFATHYPKIKPASIRAHLVQAATNDRSRLHHPSTKTSDDLLFKVASGQFRLYEPGKDPAPIHEMVEGDVAAQEEADAGSDVEDTDAGEAPVGSSAFAFEKDLQSYLARNLECIEPGLKLYEEDGVKGIEYDVGNRYIDILAVDKEGAFVVIELKVSKGYERVIGQLLRYMNWVRRDLAEPGQRVRGIIVCRDVNEDLRLACSSLKDVELCEYQLRVSVSKLDRIELPG